MNDANVTFLILGVMTPVILVAQFAWRRWVTPVSDRAFDYVWDHGLGAFLGFVFQLALLIGAIYALFVAPVVTLLVLILLVLIAR